MKLQHYYNKYNVTPLTNEQIVNAVVLYEIGMTAGPIGQNYWPDVPLDRAGRMMTKIIQKYALHVGKNKIRAMYRRNYWLNNNIAQFIMDLNAELADDISLKAQIKSMKDNVEETVFSNMHNPDDAWFKHYTRRNRTNYNAQKSMAKKRGVAWEFSGFQEWLLWWLQTGKFDERGVHNEAYQMCRKGDVGPYSWDNVYCATAKDNRSDYHNGNKQMIKTAERILLQGV